MLAKDLSQKALMLASTYLSSDTSAGHVCLLLAFLTPERIFNVQIQPFAQKAWLKIGNSSIEDWQQILLVSTAVSDSSNPIPLISDNQCLYLQHMKKYECVVAKFFNKIRAPIDSNEDGITAVLSHYFPNNAYCI
ncbi:exodeoxyribonuclease V subunit alpha family protein [Candidatus Gullanella endobia]|uniref:hypothetical protein n=1 Tax=Candidatus Gullanella endobia TaxID=1070130 RepID=UPI001315802B|nr:hypothetical protein [Candidatus Gullanella endobia]